MSISISGRSAGILLPVSSLPSPYGIGSVGTSAREWIDFMRAAGQKFWQVLPLAPTGYGDSPYQSFSSFAGNPYLIDLDSLCKQGLLRRDECEAVNWGDNPEQADYSIMFNSRENLLRAAYNRFEDFSALDGFRDKNASWIEDYALYMALKTRMGLLPWTEWEESVRLRKPDAMLKWRGVLKEDIDYHIFIQYLFFSQWKELKDYANAQGIGIIGDIPIYVSMDSADTWANSRLFMLDSNLKPIDVAGCPPDAFAPDGQLWGNPLYRWDVLKAEGYDWWLKRLKACLMMYDVVRIDHFRGFESYFAIPAESASAALGEWRTGPGMDFIGTVNREIGNKDRLIAEDLGYLTDGVRELLRNSGYRGMKVLQFAFDSREESDYMPYNYERRCVVYTGTHDNDTICGWFNRASYDDVRFAKNFLNITDNSDGCKAFIRAAFGSAADLAIIPMQDYLELGGEARINVPSTLGGNNWRWRMRKGAASQELAAEILSLTRLFGR